MQTVDCPAAANTKNPGYQPNMQKSMTACSPPRLAASGMQKTVIQVAGILIRG